MSSMHSIFSTVVNVLSENKIDYLMIGGHVVNYYGHQRFTSDIDLMMVLPNVDAFVTVMRNAGFTSYDVQPLVVFFKKPDVPVRVDFLKTDSETFAKLMQSAVDAVILDCPVKIPSLQNLLAMKFHSLAQSSLRRVKDLDDIVGLSIKHKLDVETDLHPLATRYATEQIYQLVRTMMQSGPNNNPS